MEDITVRAESPEDYRAIDVVNLSAFESEDEARLVGELREHPDYSADFSLVAEFNGRLVGHLMLTPTKFFHDGGETDVLVLAPMSVVPSQSHRGIGTDLVKAAIAIASERGFAAIFAAGKPDYYARHGFESASQRNIRCNLPLPDDALMMIELQEGALPAAGGLVNYASPFLSLY